MRGRLIPFPVEALSAHPKEAPLELLWAEPGPYLHTHTISAETYSNLCQSNALRHRAQGSSRRIEGGRHNTGSPSLLQTWVSELSLYVTARGRR